MNDAKPKPLVWFYLLVVMALIIVLIIIREIICIFSFRDEINVLLTN